MLEFLSPVLSVVGAIGAVVSLRGYFSTRNVERNKPRKDLIAALGELRDDLVDLSSAWVKLGVYLDKSDDWDPTSRFGDQTSRDAASTLLPEAVDSYKKIFEYNKKIAGSMLDILAKLGDERLAVNDKIVEDAKSLIEKLYELRCGDIDNAKADALTTEVIARASNLIEDLLAALNSKTKAAGAI